MSYPAGINRDAALRIGSVMGWGSTWLRGGFILLVLALGAGVLARLRPNTAMR